MASFMPRPRALAASVLAIVGAALFGVQVMEREGGWIPVVAIMTAAVAIFVPRLVAQLLARGLLWSNTLLGVLIAILSGTDKVDYAAPLLLGCGGALLLGERRALAEATEARDERPVAYAGTLEVLMILALADAQSFIFFAWIEGSNHHAARFYAAAALGLLVGFVGLYRLAFWGVACTMGTSALFAVGIVSDVIRVDKELSVPLLVLMALQLLVPLPMVVSAVLGRPLPELPRRTRALIGTVAISVLIVVSLVIGAAHR
jgi:hypothetical protein